jgi:hypothetical protein
VETPTARHGARRKCCSWNARGQLGQASPVSPPIEPPSPKSAYVWKACRWRSNWLPHAPELLTPKALLEQLSERLDTFSSGPADLPHSQRSIRGALDWSYQLLDTYERQLFGRMALFTG